MTWQMNSFFWSEGFDKAFDARIHLRNRFGSGTDLDEEDDEVPSCPPFKSVNHGFRNPPSSILLFWHQTRKDCGFINGGFGLLGTITFLALPC